jgi:two-component system LytT family response regulator
MYALIVDDEKRARDTIAQMIKLYCPEIGTMKEASSVKTALDIIKKEKPDILLLDIRLEDGNGFDILKKINPEDFSIIFITAYDEYAIKAFKVSAIDYLLKPLDPDELIEAIARVHKKISKQLISNRVDLFLNQIELRNSVLKKITLKTAESIYIINIEDIIYCEASKNYTTFVLVNKQKILVSKNLREYEQLLPSHVFLRPHQSYLVNLKHITQYEKGEKNCLVMTDNYAIPVSTRKKEQVMQYFKNID